MAKSAKKNPQITRPIINGEIYPRIGLALGSGAAKAICQFGILKRLTEHKIPISYITGSSMGAIIGAAYALGLDLDQVLEKAVRYAEASSINNLANFNILHESVYKKEYIDNMLKELFADFTFADCKIPLAVTAVDLESGTLVQLDKGPLVPAVRASTSIPGIFEPVLMDGFYLVDGGLLEDCPVQTLKQKGDNDLIIGCYIKDQKHRQEISAYIYNKFYNKKQKGNFITNKLGQIKTDMHLMGAILLRSLDILRTEVWRYKVIETNPDLLISINIEKVELFDFKKINELIKIGEKAFDDNYERLLTIIDRKKKELNAKSKNDNL
jgi:NTE family protein